MNYKRTKIACYFGNLSIATVFALPPMLFVTFREIYGISYTLLGTLVLTNFCTQMIVDFVFTLFTKYFNIKATVRIMPIITTIGMIIYAIVPTVLPQYAFLGMFIGTVVFSVSAGLSEVLLSPTVAALPSDNPERDMSLLHSLYGYGVVITVLISSIYLKLFGTHKWMFLMLIWALLPIICSIMFFTSTIPDMNLSHTTSNRTSDKRPLGIFLCFLCIFAGGASENTMTNWISGFVENALHISKTIGDILGLALFAAFLAVGRTLYAKYGKNISKVLLVGMISASICYLIAGVSNIPIVSMIACVFVGLCTSMLWPGSLILLEENYPKIGVFAYALMAAGGDLGSSIAPQMMGIIVDKVSASGFARVLSDSIGLSTEQIGMKSGVIISAVFPIIGSIVLLITIRYFKKTKSL